MGNRLTTEELAALVEQATASITAKEIELRQNKMRHIVEKIEEGRKADDGKAPMDLLPPELLFAVSTVLDFGAKKYAARNWEKGIRWGRVFAALMRHMWSWWRGEEKDLETGYSHLWHAGCCIAFLIAYEQRGVGEDDRPKG